MPTNMPTFERMPVFGGGETLSLPVAAADGMEGNAELPLAVAYFVTTTRSAGDFK